MVNYPHITPYERLLLGQQDAVKIDVQRPSKAEIEDKICMLSASSDRALIAELMLRVERLEKQVFLRGRDGEV